MADFGFIYVLGNECMPGVYKIGMTTRSPQKRCEELSSTTSCPKPFTVLAYIETDTAKNSESELHKTFAQYRVNKGREFFRCDFYRLLVEMWSMASYGYYMSAKVRKQYGITDIFSQACDWPETQRRIAEREANYES